MLQDPFGYHGITDKAFIGQQIDQQYNTFPTKAVMPHPDSDSFCEFKCLLFPIDSEDTEIIAETARIYGDPIEGYEVSTWDKPFEIFGEWESAAEQKAMYGI